VVDTPCLHSRTLSSLCGCEAMALRPPKGAAAAVELGGHDKLLQRSDVGRRTDHLLQFVPGQ
jgi:hypothetical protein